MKKATSSVILILFLLMGLVIGGFVGELLINTQGFSWLSYGKDFGISLSDPFLMDLGIIKIKLGLLIHINISSVIGVIVSIVSFRLLKL